MSRLADLRLQLKVNGEIRQDALAGTMIYRPAETLTDLSGITDIFTGDLILTGTPAGVALKAPSPMAQRIAHLLFPEKKRMGLFVKKQLQRSQYLKNGDRISAAIFTEDRALDLGEQSNTVNG
jgi:2-keto-4-pentenoate hydratase/2-oxohepta-3-ene-1,7-dioic acid hydratase in catechol pathway